MIILIQIKSWHRQFIKFIQNCYWELIPSSMYLEMMKTSFERNNFFENHQVLINICADCRYLHFSFWFGELWIRIIKLDMKIFIVKNKLAIIVEVDFLHSMSAKSLFLIKMQLLIHSSLLIWCVGFHQTLNCWDK